MSRSRKKYPFCGAGCETRWRRVFNKRFRLRNKDRIRQGKDPHQLKEVSLGMVIWDGAYIGTTSSAFRK